MFYPEIYRTWPSIYQNNYPQLNITYMSKTDAKNTMCNTNVATTNVRDICAISPE